MKQWKHMSSSLVILYRHRPEISIVAELTYQRQVKLWGIYSGVVSKKNALISSGEYRLCLAHQRMVSAKSHTM